MYFIYGIIILCIYISNLLDLDDTVVLHQYNYTQRHIMWSLYFLFYTDNNLVDKEKFVKKRRPDWND